MASPLRSAALVLLLAGSLAACAGDDRRFPNRPVLLVCPWAAGGGTDRVARQLAVGLERELGVPVNVVNVTGASGVNGHTRGALARADGYTLTLMTAELNMLHWRGLTSITPGDFRPVGLLNRDPAAIFVRKDAPWRTLDDLNGHVRARPRTLRASGTALGGIWHIALGAWLTAAGLEPDAVRWISIEGTSPSLQELMAGGIEIVVSSLPEARSLLESGEIRSLGVMAAERVAQFPGVPTLAEQGVDAAIGTWRGVGLPRETPEEAAQALAAALERVVTGDEFRAFMSKAGFNWAFEGPAEFGATLSALDARFGELLADEAYANIGQDIVGPMTFPAILMVLGVVVLALLLLTGGLRETAASDTFSWRGAARVALILSGVLLYVLLAEALGFIVTAFGLVSFLMWRLSVRWPVALFTSLVLVLVVYQVFAVHLRVPLPRGVLGW